MSEAGPGAERDRGFEAHLTAIGERLLDAFTTYYAPQHPAVQPILTGLLREEKKNNFFKQRTGMSRDDQSLVTVVFFGLKCLRRLMNEIPRLEEISTAAYASARSAATAAPEWSRLEPGRYTNGFVPELSPQNAWIDPRLIFGPEGVDLLPEQLGYPFERTPLESVFLVWRNAEVYGLTVASHGQNVEALQRFDPSMVAAASEVLSSPAIQVEELERAYFVHLEREIQRAQYPFGLALQENRDAMILAISLAVESESGGVLRPMDHSVDYLDADVPRRILGQDELTGAFLSTLTKMRRGDDERARPILPFDLVRAAAAVQSQAETRHDLPLVAESGWVPALQEAGFGVRVRPPRTTPPTTRLPFARELLRLLPYSLPAAQAIDRIIPAGSAREIRNVSKRLELGDTNGRPRDDAIIAAVRSEIVDAYYRERLSGDQRSEPVVRPIAAVDSVLSALLAKRILNILKEANKRPLETPFDPEEEEQGLGLELGRVALEHDAMFGKRTAGQPREWTPNRSDGRAYDAGREAAEQASPSDAAEPAAPAARAANRTGRFGGFRGPWVDDFVHLIPPYMASFESYCMWLAAAGIVSKPADLDAIRQLDAFTKWLTNEVKRRESQVTARAAQNRDDSKAGRSKGGQVLPPKLHRARLADDFDLSLAEAITSWTAELPVTATARGRAAKGVEQALRRIFQSPIWVALANGVPLTEIQRRADVSVHETIQALDDETILREILPQFLVDLIGDIPPEDAADAPATE